MKKFLSLILVVIMMFSLAACNNTGDTETTAPASPTENTSSSESSSSESSSSSEQKPPENENDTTKVFDENKIVFSFAAISDIHIGNDTSNRDETQFKNALLQIKAFAQQKDADGIDAILAVGDLFEGSGYGGSNDLIKEYKKIYESVYDPTVTPMIHAVGNHDLKWDHTAKDVAALQNTMLGSNYFLTDIDQNILAKEGNRHCVIDGYHIITLLPVTSTQVSYTQATKDWLDQTLAQITAENPNAYVIILTHPMIYDTVYGSTLGREPGSTLTDMWATSDLTDILSKYNQVITFGGHLHFPLNDPRSIMQTAFTSLGCGSVNYMAIEDGKYENMASATTMKDKNEFSQGLICQIDENGNMRITRMDFYNETTIGEVWEISHPTSDGSHLTAYGKDRGSPEKNSAPVISQNIKAVITKSGNKKQVTIEFDAAQDDTFVHHYTMVFKNTKTGKTLKTFNILSDFYRASTPEDMSQTLSCAIGTLGSNDYEVILTAYDSWGAASESVSLAFKVE
ncbi:MAG: metallophosphoesterase [Clostridia bacterium]|nr:metallophosphoesterase [Clostridia bacterium]